MNLNNASLFSMSVYNDLEVGETGPYGSTVIRSVVSGDFAAVAFYVASTNEVVVAYRGTDDQEGEFGDKLTGWPIGIGLYGLPETQADKAFAFYNDVLADIADPAHPAHVASTASISFTGHSLGGGLAGLVSSFAGKPAFVFDSMPFTDAATNLHADVTGPDAANFSYWSALAFPDGQPHEPSFSLVQAASMGGEVLSDLRYGRNFTIPTTIGGVVISSGHDAQTIVQNELYGGTLTDPVDLHSMGLLAIALHGGLQHSEDEKAGADAFYQYLFDASFASGLGFASTTALQDALAHSLSEGTSSLDSFFSDMTIIGNILRTGFSPYADALARMSITHAVHVATENGNLRSGLIEVRDGYANIALTGVHDAEAMVLDLLQYSSSAFGGATFDVPLSGHTNLAVELSGYGGEVHLGPGGTLYFGSLYDDDIYGSASADFIVSLGSDSQFSDTIRGGGGNDTILASSGNGEITGGAGNDTINGGAGTDKAFYSGNIADYGIAVVGSKIVLTDTMADRDGVDTLTGIEELFFDDGSIIVANLPKAPTSFDIDVASDLHTHIARLGVRAVASLTNVVDVDGGTNRLEIDAENTDAVILPYLQAGGSNLYFLDDVPAGSYQVGLRTYDAVNGVRSETQVVSIGVQENTAPTGVWWESGGTLNENPADGALVGYLRVADADTSFNNGYGEVFAFSMIGDYGQTYGVSLAGPGRFKISVLDGGNVDYERDNSPTLTFKVTDIAGHQRTFDVDISVANTANTSWMETAAGTASMTRTRNGGSQDDYMDASIFNGKYTLNGGAGGDTLIGGKNNDTINGGVGNDIMRGNGGNDRFESYSGSDTIYGGLGTTSWISLRSIGRNMSTMRI